MRLGSCQLSGFINFNAWSISYSEASRYLHWVHNIFALRHDALGSWMSKTVDTNWSAMMQDWLTGLLREMSERIHPQVCSTKQFDLVKKPSWIKRQRELGCSLPSFQCSGSMVAYNLLSLDTVKQQLLTYRTCLSAPLVHLWSPLFLVASQRWLIKNYLQKTKKQQQSCPLLSLTNHHLWWGRTEVVVIYPDAMKSYQNAIESSYTKAANLMWLGNGKSRCWQI